MYLQKSDEKIPKFTFKPKIVVRAKCYRIPLAIPVLKLEYENGTHPLSHTYDSAFRLSVSTLTP